MNIAILLNLIKNYDAYKAVTSIFVRYLKSDTVIIYYDPSQPKE